MYTYEDLVKYILDRPSAIPDQTCYRPSAIPDQTCYGLVQVSKSLALKYDFF